MPSITADLLAVLALASAALALLTGQRSLTFFNGGILLAVCLLIVSGLPILSHLPWAEWVDASLDQVVALLHFLEVAYTVWTL
ncbi:hypothetical protein [Bradyrhizobium daqingense]|uniref:Uncharacterized protein n=1 Tax=Bradyrhizobium daqingense TaxID=993502 RepID=A0A562LQ34_9BRAD|nr:hypothetical protein IQ17_00791 [Bradyrhizobium daqingense]